MREDSEKPGELPTDRVSVRSLHEADLSAIVRIDAAATGRSRGEYYREKISAALRDDRMRPSLVGELDGMVVGFLMTTMHYGEFGRVEPTAVIDSLGVHPEFRGERIGEALMRQLIMNARALGVERIRTEVRWNDSALVAFFDRHEFLLSDRIVLERALDD